MLKITEFLGSLSAVLAALLVAHGEYQIAGYILFIFSGVCLVPWAWYKKAYSLLTMQAILFMISFFGLLARVI